MNQKERVEILLNKDIPDRMGIFEHFWEETLKNWASEDYPEGIAPEEYFDYDIFYGGCWIIKKHL